MTRHHPLLAAACAAMFAAAPVAFAQQTGATKSASTQATSASVSKSDQRYFHDLAEANRAEVELGKLAQSKATSDQVKQFANHMVEDHGRMLKDVMALAAAKHVQLPGTIDQKHQEAMKRLQGLSGAEFDRAYSKQMVQGHESTVKKLQQIADKADDPQLKKTAEMALPDIKKHLQMARNLDAGKVAATEKGHNPR